MGRMVRTLMRVPAVRRVMVRLANLEDAIARQQASLDALDGDQKRLGADQADHHERLEQVAALRDAVQIQKTRIEALAPRVEVATLADAVRTLRAELGELLEQVRPAQRANLETTLHGQQLQLGALNSTANAQQMQLAALNDSVAAMVEHLSAARRANLEATLHGQQLQLGALSSTVNAQQMQLAALNDLVRRAISEPQVGPAHQPASIEAARPARPAVSPYTFDQLLNQEVEKLGLDLVFNIHVPKAAGNSANLLFRHLGFVPLMLDMNTNDFFQTVREDRWFEGYEAPAPRVAAYLMTGHMRLDHPIFRRLWIPHVIVSMLRDPLERMMSHYNFTLRLPDNPWHADVVSRRMSLLEYAGKMLDAIGPQYSFFDDTGRGTFARTGTASVQDCLSNLLTKVSFYGLCDRFDEFAVMSGYLLGRRSFLAVAPVNVTGEIEDLGGGVPPKTTLTDEERDGLTTMLRDDIWFYEQAAKEYEKRVADSRLQTLFAQMLPVVKSSREAMRGLLAIRDPADPDRRAFAQAR